MILIQISRPKDATNGGTTLVNWADVSTIEIVKLLPPSGMIGDASNAAPIVITSPNHGLVNGASVNVADVQGNTAANGGWKITIVDKDKFSLNGSVGNGAFVAGTGGWTLAQDQFSLVIKLAASSRIVVIAQMDLSNNLKLKDLTDARDAFWNSLQAAPLPEVFNFKGTDVPDLRAP